ncbi:MAG: hypothetical protein K0U47_08060, partial [Epsilonproteobacteria bacterium]|nr:hypothetical protein [Campylobacterota bacterium]
YENDTKNLYSRLGISQNYQLNKYITLAGGVESRSTMSGEDNQSEDFKAYAGSITYNRKPWVSNLKAEYRDGKKEDKLNLDFGIYNQLSDDIGVSCGVRYNNTKSEQERKKHFETNFGTVYRPKSRWIILNRFDFVHLSSSTEESEKFINNFLLNYNFTQDLELSLQFGLKYVQEQIDNQTFDSVVNLLGVHMVMQIGKNFDLGLQTSTLYNHSTKQLSYMYGAEVGYTLMGNSWLGVGYNFKGFSDEDFSLQNYTTQGAYLKVRMKFDKENLKSMMDHTF